MSTVHSAIEIDPALESSIHPSTQRGKGDFKERKEIKETEVQRNSRGYQQVKQHTLREPTDSKENKEYGENKEFREDQDSKESNDEKFASEFRDPSPSLPSYTANMISTLLKMNGVGTLSSTLPKDSSGQFDIYAYERLPLTPNMLIKDTIEYMLTRKKAAGDRRVVFLLPTAKGVCALFVQCQGFNKNLAASLFALLEQRDIDSTDTIMTIPEVQILFTQLYSDVNCFFLRESENPSHLQQLKVPMEQAYARSNLNFINIVVTNPSIVLFENLLSMLKLGSISEINTLKAYCKHREQACMALNQALKTLKNRDQGSYEKILSYLAALFKFMDLVRVRAKRYDLKGNDLETMELLLERDERAKIAIFQSAVDISACLIYLDLAPLLQMMNNQDKPEALLADLKKALQLEITKSREWMVNIKAQQAELNKRWIPYFQHKAKKTGQFIYSYSLLGIGGDFLRWLARPVVDYVVTGPIAAEAKQYMQAGTKTLVFCLTLSSTLAKKSYEITGRVLCKENIPKVLKMSGIGLGLIYTYSSGVYQFLRQMGIIAFSLKAGSRLTRINDNESAVLSPQKYWNPSLVHRATSLAVATLESTYLKDSRPLVCAIGGMGGSIGLTALATRVVPGMRPAPSQPKTEDQVFMEFLLSTVGYSLGQSLADYGMNAWNTVKYKQAVRERVLEYLASPEGKERFVDLKIENPRFIAHPLLWFNQKNPIQLTWRDRKGPFYVSECQIQEQPLNNYLLDCERPKVGPPRLTRD